MENEKITGECYLTLQKRDTKKWNEDQVIQIMNCTKNKPALTGRQIAIKINLELSRSLFETYCPNVDIKIDEEHIITPDITVTPEAAE